MEQERLDKIMFTLGLTRSRSEAEDLIKRGLVSVKDTKGNFAVVKKPSKSFADLNTADIQISTAQYVSRGAYKLLKALEVFNISVDGLVTMDIGSSTGGFTEVLLEKGAKQVFAIDVGTEQLHSTLKSHDRVVSLENTDIQKLESVPTPIDFFVIDISFISMNRVIPHLLRFTTSTAEGVILVKPQFEVGKEYLSKSGVVKNEKAVWNALTAIRNTLREHGFALVAETDSPIQGGSGNIEYLWHIKRIH